MVRGRIPRPPAPEPVYSGRSRQRDANCRDPPSQRALEGRPFTLRYAMLHLIEETARHNGHLDVLRELADGVTGM
jgi:Protein of unknown function (DUF664)